MYGITKRRTLSSEITVLNMLTSVCTLLFLGIAMLLVFFFVFFRSTKDDMEYVLENTGQQFQDRIQFIEDGAVTIRHNVWLEDFFWGDFYDEEAAGEQLSYSMELFSDRNMVQQKIPFVRSVYLFNNINQCIYDHYYPVTVSEARQKQEDRSHLQEEFRKTKGQYLCYSEKEEIFLCFRIYDDKMRNMGSCIVEISPEAIQLLMKEIEGYGNGTWAVLWGKEKENLTFSGKQEEIEVLKQETQEEVTDIRAEGTSFLAASKNCGFGIWILVAAGLNNVYTLLKPTMLIFLAAFLLILVITSSLSFAVSYRFTKPLKKVIESLRALGQEDFKVRMEDYPIQEFHDMSVVFNEMADRIEYLITQVYEKQLLVTQAQVKFLQAQINPHFQYNILAMLSIRAKMAGNEELYQYLQAFSKLMQGKIFRGKEIKIPVSAEMEIVDFYLLLQNGRYQDKISYEIRYGSEEVKQDLIPRLLIEPLVENAVSHGLEPKNGNGKIVVEIFEQDEKLNIMVADDGVGFSKEENGRESMQKKAGHTHTALENTKRLLHILYGENYILEIQGEKDNGTTVRIVLPIERGMENVEGNGGR